jgi:hypothetical protein
MSVTMTEAQESETWGPGTEGESEPAGETLESEAYPTEAGWAESSGDDARRRRQRRIMVARRQAQPSRPSARPPAPAPPRTITAGPEASQAARAASQAVRAVSDDVLALDHETKAALRSLHRELEKAKRHGNEAAYAATAGAILNQGLDTFEGNLANHPLVRAAARLAPIGLLYSFGPDSGAGKIFGNPIFITTAGIGLILLSGQLVSASEGTNSVVVSGPNIISIANNPTSLAATALGQKGNEIANANYVWSTDDQTYATVDSSGNVTGLVPGQSTWVTATSGGVTGRLWVTITP